MNKGDLVVCIKDAVYDINCETPTGITETLYKKGEFYEINEIKIIDDKNLYVDIKRKDKDSSTGFWQLAQIEEWYKFDEYFITLADWRDKQIDSILNDD